MLVFLSAMETSQVDEVKYILNKTGGKFYFNLMSYFYLTKNIESYNLISENSTKLMIDSGAHSFQKGKKVNWKEYTISYANWIKKNNNSKIIGFFEMDIDPGGYPYEFVLELRKILLNASDKIIPVWHKNRGVDDFYKMCENPIHRDKVIAITGFKNQDIKDSDYFKYVSYAHSKGCKVHCLGMTRKNIMDEVPFDYVDSSSWKMSSIFGKYGKEKLPKHIKIRGITRSEIMAKSYLTAMNMQEEYYLKWKHYLNSIHSIHKRGESYA